MRPGLQAGIAYVLWMSVNSHCRVSTTHESQDESIDISLTRIPEIDF